MKRKWLSSTINRLIIKIKNHYFIDESVKLMKWYSNDSQKAVQRLQLTMIQRKKKMNRNIKTTTKYIIDDYKRAFNDILIDFLTSILNDFRATDLMMNDLKLMKDFQTNVSFGDNFIKSSSVIVNRVIIIEINISTFSKIIMFKFMISMFAFVTSFRFSRSKID